MAKDLHVMCNSDVRSKRVKKPLSTLRALRREARNILLSNSLSVLSVLSGK
jgi:hypothetical protein